MLKLTLIALCALILAGCSAGTPSAPQADVLSGSAPFENAPEYQETELQNLVTSYHDFALAIFTAQAERKENLLISPFSLYEVLSMLYAGASGQTATEIATALHLPPGDMSVHRLWNALNQRLRPAEKSGSAAAFDLQTANALWVAQGREFQGDFLNILSQHYNTGLNTLNFADTQASVDAINAWSAEKTAQKITNLAEPSMLSADTALVLTNAVYFKAAWAYPFNEFATQDAPFTLLGGEEIHTATMSLSETLSVSVNESLTLVRLPYADSSVVMEILMPKLQAWEFPEALAETITSPDVLSELKPTSVILRLPKFRIESPTLDLIPALQASGMQLAFTDAADFSGISGDQSLYVSTVAQKAFIDVSETGTEAAAATIAEVRPKMAPGGEPLRISIDHPFVFQIRDTSTGAILFMGMVVQP